MTRTIDFYYDILSPFAHVAMARLHELPAGTAIRPKPVLLGAILTHWGQRGPAEIEPKRLHTYRIASFLGERQGLKLKFPPRHPFNPLAALRVLAGADADVDMVRRAFNFVFVEGRAIDNEAELAAFAEALGVSSTLANDDEAKAKLRSFTDEALASGVFGVPTFAVPGKNGRELFWGVDSFDMLKAYLAEDAMFAREPYAHLAGVEVGVTRKA